MKIEEFVELAPLTTMRVGGKARFFTIIKTQNELREALAFVRDKKLPWMLLGGGSNLVFSDDDYPGIVLALKYHQLDWDVAKQEVTVGTGLLMRNLVEQTTQRGWAGLEWAGGLPGSVGGAIRGNAGAFGGETKDSVISVTAIEAKTGREKNWQSNECRFGYRTSLFKTEPWIIWEARFKF
ncbi:MAG: FAD-binding protein, partial [Patescibacteria group bacterium]